MQPIAAENIAFLVTPRGGRRVVAVRGPAGSAHVSGLSADEWSYAESNIKGFPAMLKALDITRASEGL